MRSPVIESFSVPTLVIAAALSVSPPAVGQRPPPSALVNQGSEEPLEAARAASLRTSDETFAYFEEEVELALARAIERVWDPTRPRERSPRTPWGDPDLRGYWISGSSSARQQKG